MALLAGETAHCHGAYVYTYLHIPTYLHVYIRMCVCKYTHCCVFMHKLNANILQWGTSIVDFRTQVVIIIHSSLISVKLQHFQYNSSRVVMETTTGFHRKQWSHTNQYIFTYLRRMSFQNRVINHFNRARVIIHIFYIANA